MQLNGLQWGARFLVIVYLFNGMGVMAEEETDLRTALRSLWKQPLKPIEEIVPGYIRPAAEPPSLIVANLRYKGTDGLLWGKALGGILRWNTAYCPKGLLVVPDTLPSNLYYDLGASSISKEEVLESTGSLRVAYDRLGMENGLVGEVKISDVSFNLQFDLIGPYTTGIKHSFGYKGQLDELPGALSQTVLETFKALGVELTETSKSYIENPPTKTFPQLRQYVEALTHSNTPEGAKGFRGIVDPLLSEGCNLPMSIIPVLLTENLSGSLSLEQYRGIESLYTIRWPDNAGIWFYLARYKVVPEENQLLNTQISLFKHLVAENPNDPMMMILLGSQLIEAKDYCDALPVYLELTERFPGFYRGWWGTSDCLTKLAWGIRGKEGWDETLSSSRYAFSNLMPLTHRTVNRSLKLNPECAYTWDIKMRAYGGEDGCSVKFFRCFDKAAEFGPDWKWIYEDAYNFTQGIWGGTQDDRERVLATAARLNPDAIWPQELHLKWGMSELRIQEADEYENPADCRDYAKKLAGYAQLVSGEKRTGQHDWPCLEIFCKGGAYNEGQKLIRTMLKEMEGRGWKDDYLSLNLYLLAAYALEFNDPGLAKECLAQYQGNEYLEGTTRKVQCLLASVDILAGSREKGEEKFRSILKDHPMDFMARNVILDLSTRAPLDPALIEECQSLIASASVEQASICQDIYANLSKKEEAQCREEIMAFLRQIALAHKTAREPRPRKAVHLYRDAIELAKKNDTRYFDRRDPILFGPLYRQIQIGYREEND